LKQENTEEMVKRDADADDFLLNASEPSLAAICDNADDDIHAELLECDIQMK